MGIGTQAGPTNRRHFDTPVRIVIQSTPRRRGSDASPRGGGRTDQAPEILDRRNGVERAEHDLTRPGLLGLVDQPGFEQLGVGEDHAELIVEPVKDLREVRRRVRRRVWCAGSRIRRHG